MLLSVKRLALRSTVPFLAASLFLLYPSLALAQAAPPPPPPAREGSVEFAFIGTTGNSSTETIGLGGEVILRPTLWVVKNKAAFIRNESNSSSPRNRFSTVSHRARAHHPRLRVWRVYVFHDGFAGIAHRNAVVGGIAYKLIDLPSQKLSVDAGLGYLNEHRLRGSDVSSGTYSFGGGYAWKISPTAELSDDVRFTGTFAASDDWRVANIVAISARITSLFSLKASNTIRFANVPVPGFKSTDTNTAIALVAKF